MTIGTIEYDISNYDDILYFIWLFNNLTYTIEYA